MMRRLSLKSAVAASAFILMTGAAPAPDPEATRIAARLASHVETLASDRFEGRLPGTIGETRTVAYIERTFRAIGLKPGGEVIGGKRSWYQMVPLVNVGIAGPVAIAIEGPGAPMPVTQGQEIVVQATAAAGDKVDIAGAPMVFVGYGIDAPERGWDDYKGIDLKGKVAVYLFGDPIAPDGTRRFGGKTLTAAGAPARKTEAAVKRGAIATLMVHEPKVLGYEWATTASSSLQVRQDIVREDVARRNAPVQGTVRYDVATRLLSESGRDFAALKAAAAEASFRPVPLPQRLSVRLDVTRHILRSRTVIGLLPGTSRAGDTMIFGAHWDHMGSKAADSGGDRIYNGAIDNASGVATMLEVARAMAQRGRAERSVAFAAWTLEEPGILGSEYYALHPVYPLARTVAVINFDAMFPLGRARDFSNNANVETDLHDLLAAAGARQGRTIVADAHPEMFLRLRSDHAPLAKRGVPPIFYLPGEDLIDGGKAASQKYIGSYFATRYHRQSDDYSRDMNFDGVAQDVELLADFGWRLANSSTWPEWKPDGEFKAVRDATAAERR